MKLRHLVLILGFIYLNHPVLAKPGVTDQVRPVRTELYFGWVPSVEWKEFLAKVVTPLFPDGLTWFDVAGQWKAPAGEIEKEHSRLLIILYPDTQQNDQAVEKIRQRFKVRFHQQAVLRVSVKVEAKDLSALDPSTEFLGSVAKIVGRGTAERWRQRRRSPWRPRGVVVAARAGFRESLTPRVSEQGNGI